MFGSEDRCKSFLNDILKSSSAAQVSDSGQKEEAASLQNSFSFRCLSRAV